MKALLKRQVPPFLFGRTLECFDSTELSTGADIKKGAGGGGGRRPCDVRDARASDSRLFSGGFARGDSGNQHITSQHS